MGRPKSMGRRGRDLRPIVVHAKRVVEHCSPEYCMPEQWTEEPNPRGISQVTWRCACGRVFVVQDA